MEKKSNEKVNVCVLCATTVGESSLANALNSVDGDHNRVLVGIVRLFFRGTEIKNA